MGAAKALLSPRELLVRAGIAGAMLGTSETLLFTAFAQTGLPIIGALIFPVGFAMIMVLGLDLVTGSFGILPMAVMAGRASVGQMLVNWVVTFIGNFIGALIFAGLAYAALTNLGHDAGGVIADKMRAAVTSRSAGYAALGGQGWAAAFIKAMLCNWLVCLGVVMSVASSTSVGKILGCWLPIAPFVALGYEHCVVNMSLFPLGIMLGAGTTVTQFLAFNELPVTLGNILGGFLFTGLALYLAYPRSALNLGQDPVSASSATAQAAE